MEKNDDDNLEKANDVENVETNDDPTKVPHGNTQDSFKDISEGISTEQIIKMYENVEFEMNDNTEQISTDNILKMYETEDLIEESSSVIKSTRKQRKKKILLH